MRTLTINEATCVFGGKPIVRDMRIFSDKVARHPELIGVGGALKGSSGLKDDVQPAPARQAVGRARSDQR